MGLSLPSFKKIGDVLSGVEHQVNPFDNGQTYNTVRQNRAPIPNTPSFSQRYSPANIASGIGQGFVHTGLGAENFAQGAVQGLLRTPLEIGATFSNRDIPLTPREQILFGKGNVQSIQNIGRSNYRGAIQGKHPGLALPGTAALVGAHIAADFGPSALKAAKLTKAVNADLISKGLSTEAGMIAGPKSPGFKLAGNQGKTFSGVDNKLRYEISDKNAKINPNPKDNTLGSVLDHPELYKQYPDLAKVPVSQNNKIPGTALFNGRQMVVNPDKINNANHLKSVLLHETTHAIQNIEKYNSGGSPAMFNNDMGQYRRLAGEVEARAVQKRMNYSEAKLARKPFAKSYDVKPENQIVKGMNGSPVNAPVVRPRQMNLSTKTAKIHPEDQNTMVKFIDYTRLKQPYNHQLELAASRIAEHYNMKLPKNINGLANEFERQLQTTKLKPRGAALQAHLGKKQNISMLTDKPGKFPSLAEFEKMIPAVKGTKVPGAASTAFRAGKTTLREPANIPRTPNPIKRELSNPKAGDYGAAITDKQRVESSIGLAASRAETAVKALSNNDKALFAHARENPELINQADNPNQLKEAIKRFGAMTDTAHAYDVATGGKTPHIGNYYRHVVDLSNPEDAARFNDIAQQKGYTTDPFAYQGLNNQPRVFKTIAEAEQNGFNVTNKDPLQEIQDYANKAKGVVRNQALARGAQLADAARGPEASLTKKFELSPGNYVDISPEAAAKLRGVEQLTHSTKPIIKGLRTANVGTKSTILSLGQFHTINIGALRAAPTLLATGHPVAAAKGLYGMFRAAFGSGYADRVIGKALQDGTVDKAAQIGMPYGGTGYNVEGTFLKHGVGSRTVFGKQIPMMHDQVARSIIHDLEKSNVPLDSPQAREAGLAGANLMGELNKELQNINPLTRKAMTEGMLAGQFTPSKFLQVIRAVKPSSYTKGGVAGKYAATSVLANVAATTAVIAGIGYIGKQKSDNAKDLLLRALIDPAAPTNQKDAKGNTIKLRTPGTDTSDIAKLLGIRLVRNSDGHLGVSWKADISTQEDFARARLSPYLSDGVKILTNTTFANKPLYDPNAPLGTKAIQGATSILTGHLPIGLQGLPQTKAVKSRLPGSAQEVLNAQKPGTNPLVKSIGSSFGLTPSTDTTVGKGLETTRYFDNLDKAGKGLNSQEAAALKLYSGSKKNPVTGKYDVQPSVNDQRAKATALLQNPKVIDHLIAMNKNLSKEGSKVDPLWQQSKDNITKYLQYQAMPYGGADRTHWHTANDSWYLPLADKRTAFFDALPPADPNKPQAPIEFPKPSSTVADKQKTFFNITDSAKASAYIRDNPDLQAQLDKQVTYSNQMREAQGYSKLDTFLKASPEVQGIIDTYNKLPKNDGPKGGNKTRSLWIQAHPNEYAAMTKYFSQSSLYGLQKEVGQSQFQDTGLSQKGLKELYNLGKYDVTKSTDANGNTFYALGGSSGSSSSSSGRYASGGSKYVSRTAARMQNPAAFSVDIDAGKKPRVTALRKGAPKNKVKLAKLSSRSSIAVKGKPQVSSVKSMV